MTKFSLSLLSILSLGFGVVHVGPAVAGYTHNETQTRTYGDCEFTISFNVFIPENLSDLFKALEASTSVTMRRTRTGGCQEPRLILAIYYEGQDIVDRPGGNDFYNRWYFPIILQNGWMKLTEGKNLAWRDTEMTAHIGQTAATTYGPYVTRFGRQFTNQFWQDRGGQSIYNLRTQTGTLMKYRIYNPVNGVTLIQSDWDWYKKGGLIDIPQFFKCALTGISNISWGTTPRNTASTTQLNLNSTCPNSTIKITSTTGKTVGNILYAPAEQSNQSWIHVSGTGFTRLTGTSIQRSMGASTSAPVTISYTADEKLMNPTNSADTTIIVSFTVA